MKLSELGEFGFIERIKHHTGNAYTPGTLGIGDDCAGYEIPSGSLLLTSTDLLLEGVHFQTAWTGFYDLGCKAVAVNVSDIAAMGGTARAIFLALAAPADFPVEDLETLVAGVADEASRYGAELLGGDTCRSPGPLLLGVTVQGHTPYSQQVLRSGAQPGDHLWVSGSLGDSALALTCLQKGKALADDLARRHHRPEARIDLGRELAQRGMAKAMIDVSDGLLSDLGHILQASGVGAVVHVDALPRSESFSRHLEQEPRGVVLALKGGEDYELLFSCAPERFPEVTTLSRELGIPLTKIGEVRDLAGVELKGVPEGVRLDVGGFDHFNVRASQRES